jgi:multidrug efflux pump subunit AcrA (membrane-fusion protein)
MKHRLLITLSLVLLLFFTACSSQKPIEKPTEKLNENVSVELVQTHPIKEVYETTGTVRAKTSSILASKVMGQVTAIYTKEGDQVKSGQVLITIDDREQVVQVKKAQAGLTEAESGLTEMDQVIAAAESAKSAATANRNLAASTYQRYKALLERDSVSRQEFDEVDTKYKAATAELERSEKIIESLKAKKAQAFARIDQAKADITSSKTYQSYNRIVAPFTGIVTSKNVDLGMMATPGQALLTIEDTQNYQLEAFVAESKIKLIRSGDELAVYIDSISENKINGKVVELVPSADVTSRSFLVKISLPSGLAVRSGMFGRVEIPMSEKPIITIPAIAIKERGQLTSVYVLSEKGNPQMRLVKTGKSYGDRVEILSGLDIGEKVLLSEPKLAQK